MPPPNDEVLTVQNEVFEDEIAKEHAEGKELSFVILNSPIFRLFTEELSPEVRDIWNRYAAGDKSALALLEQYYDAYKNDLTEFIARLDPDASNALSEAIEQGDIDGASAIIETNAHLRKNSES